MARTPSVTQSWPIYAIPRPASTNWSIEAAGLAPNTKILCEGPTPMQPARFHGQNHSTLQRVPTGISRCHGHNRPQTGSQRPPATCLIMQRTRTLHGSSLRPMPYRKIPHAPIALLLSSPPPRQLRIWALLISHMRDPWHIRLGNLSQRRQWQNFYPRGRRVGNCRKVGTVFEYS